MGSQDNSPLERLSQILNIPDLGGEDWDLMFADSERVDEFCDAYENAPLNADEKIALMELIVASYDCHLIGAAASALESRVSRLLEHDFDLHRQTIGSALKSWNPDRLWRVSPLMRKILSERGTMLNNLLQRSAG